MLNRKFINLLRIICISILLTNAGCSTSQRPKPSPLPPSQAQSQIEILSNQAVELNPRVLNLALNAYKKAANRGLVKQPKLTVIDYSLPSVVPRLWVFDLNDNKLLYQLHVTHGAKSGLLNATEFSNQHDSHKSSLGVFLTEEAYYGRYGYSLRLKGLEKGFNDNARSRAIVMHGAEYATAEHAVLSKRLGRSWGCPAIDPKVSTRVVEELKQGSLIFAYYPEENWLKQSNFM